MKKVEYSGTIKEFVDQYDKLDHHVWNQTTNEISEVRKHIRDHYLKEQKFLCAYCRAEKKEHHGMVWDIDHILPKALFPEFLFEPENLAIVCKECNIAKDNANVLSNSKRKLKAFPTNSGAYAIVHPHFDIYSNHFEVSVIGGKRRYRMLNKHKARFTYITCNLSRFDYEYAEWVNFDEAIVAEISELLDHCPSDASLQEIQRILRIKRFVVNVDF